MANNDRPPSPAPTCVLCGAQLPASADRCVRCGAAPSQVSRCAHCGASTSVKPNELLGWVCEVCGGARLAPAVPELDAGAVQHLRTATHERRVSTVTRAVAIVGFSLAALSGLFLGVIAALFHLGLGATVGLLMLPMLCVLIAIFALARSRQSNRNMAVALEYAHRAAITTLLAAQPRGATAPELAQSLNLAPAYTERLLRDLNVHDAIASDVTDDGQLRFRAASVPSNFVPSRVEDEPSVNEPPLSDAELVANPDTDTTTRAKK